MAAYVVLVEITVDAKDMDRFMELMMENARTSVKTEKGCQQFDIIRSNENLNLIMLYEVYDSEAAFAEHRTLPHVTNFLPLVKPMITSQSARRLYVADGNIKK